ncbi:ABC transporter substrate-binding protein [Amycolatopsis saalfeldensis]|uniref:Iron complex transport system substrate-binding protein n=1 Tax=Amycolatopsis saalfeldensis TaxID=394193 RepID=A0A1H8X8R7_9PSEU|nr:ABC transporter substrate-binding protein [Amycolatopsis saalfeldensis]SEP36103.1 iron complex transport system substrate-binding protein [Amycolatopsis saalfeldensis]
MSHQIGRRAALQGALATSLAAALTACGNGDQAAAPQGASAPGFPVSIPGVEGKTTIPRPPQRVVSVGQYRDADAAVALGVVPLITPDLGKFLPGGMSPWLRAKAGDHLPELYADTQLPFERIAALRPDLILGTDRPTLAQDYRTLSAIAPTVSSAAGYNKDTWPVTTRRVGTALGRRIQAEKLIADVEAQVKAAKTANPGFSGRTFTIGPVTGDGTITTISSAKDASALFFGELGLVLSPKVTSLPQTSIPGRSQVSPERLDLLDADVLVLTYTTPGSRAQTEAQPLFQQLAAVRRGSYLALDLTTAIALAFPSALSVPYGLSQCVPKLAAALARH